MRKYLIAIMLFGHNLFAAELTLKQADSISTAIFLYSKDLRVVYQGSVRKDGDIIGERRHRGGVHEYNTGVWRIYKKGDDLTLALLIYAKLDSNYKMKVRGAEIPFHITMKETKSNYSKLNLIRQEIQRCLDEYNNTVYAMEKKMKDIKVLNEKSSVLPPKKQQE